MNNNIIISSMNAKIHKFILVAGFLLLSFSSYPSEISINAQTKNISVQIENKSIKDALDYIESNSDFIFLYYGSVSNGAKKVSLKFTDQPIEKVLDRLFEGTSNSYIINERQIVIKERKSAPASVPATAATQKKKITGVVKDEQGELLAGATIRIANSTRGVTTDIDGTFTMDAETSDKLLISFIGYEEVTIPVGNKTTFNVTLKPKVDELQEVTVVAFGKQKKESVIGSISTISPAELKAPTSNLTTALAGRVAGMISYQRSGEPGQDNADFFIRGVTTFGYKVDPLILIDNMEVTNTDLARLQVDDIASFSIMKDATATALYGARGANGVILVTTKQGVEGPARLSVRYEGSVSAATQDVELADPVTYMKLHNEAVLTRNPLGMLPYSNDKIAQTAAGGDKYLYPSTDWKKELLKNSTFNQRVNLNIQGGGTVARYFVSGSFNKDNGILKVPKANNFNNNISLSTYSLRANVNINLTKTTEMAVRMNGRFDDYSGPTSGGSQIYNNIMHTNPVLFPPFYEAGQDQQYVKHILFGNYGEGNYLNPYADMVKGYKNSSTSTMVAQIELKQNLDMITKGLSFRGLVNTTRNAFFDVSRQYVPFWYQATGIDPITGNYQLRVINEEKGTEYLDYKEGSKTVSSLFYLEAAIDYSRTFNKKHTVSGLLVYTMRNSLNGNAGTMQESLAFRNIGLSGRATYGFDKRYFTEFNFGYNGSERFHKSKRFGFFPSAGLAWSISNEAFWENIKPVVSNLKLRGSYGLVGNDAIGSAKDRFFYLSDVNMGNGDRGGKFGIDGAYSKPGISINRYSNPDISWEVSYKSNVAVELGLFEKLNVIAEYFHEKRKNILMERASIPSSMGLSAAVRANVGEAMGEGVDISADYNHSFNKDFWMQGRANFTYATSKYLVYEEPDYDKSSRLSKIGYSLGQEWGYLADRLFIDDEEVRNSPYQNFGEYMGGDIKYHDVNGDGKITELDKVPIGYPTTPEIIYGFGLSTGYKGFDFSMFFQGSARSSFWIDPKATSPFKEETQLLKAYADNHWSEENRNVYALWPRLSPTVVSNNKEQSTWFMQDGSFLRLKQMELGYTVPNKITRKFKVERLRFYTNGSNLFLWSKFKLWDVEMAGNGLGYPVQRVFNFGLNISL